MTEDQAMAVAVALTVVFVGLLVVAVRDAWRNGHRVTSDWRAQDWEAR